MSEVKDIWEKRAKAYWQEAMRYFILMANSGLLFTIYFLIIVGGYYYQQILEWLPESFLAEWVFIAIFVLLLVRTNIRTFIKEGDLVFLLPLEGRLAPYIRRSIIYSCFIQSAVIVLVMVVLAPLYLHTIGDMKQLMVTLLLIIVAKCWNVIAKWASLRYGQKRDQLGSTYFIRLPINATFVFILFFQANIFYIITILFIMGLLYLFYYRSIRKFHSLKWERLFEIEEEMLHRFYQIANFFTDVPKLKHRTKERAYLNFIFNFIRYEQNNTYLFLFLRSFVRANDYLGIYVRLIFVTIIFLYVIPYGVIHFIVYIAFLFLTSLQLSTLMYHYQFHLWLDLYPIDAQLQKRALSKLIFILLVIKCVIVSLVVVWMTKMAMSFFIYGSIGILFSYFCAYRFIYMKRKKHAM